jgi:HEPN domain-containing protein
MFRKDFQDLAASRIREARALLDVRLFDGAYYVGGLAVECALKACLARMTQRYEFPDLNRTRGLYTHSLEDLLKQAGLQEAMRKADLAIQEAWARARSWKVEVRYELGVSETDAAEFVRSVGGRKGVLPWVRQYW